MIHQPFARMRDSVGFPIILRAAWSIFLMLHDALFLNFIAVGSVCGGITQANVVSPSTPSVVAAVSGAVRAADCGKSAPLDALQIFVNSLLSGGGGAGLLAEYVSCSKRSRPALSDDIVTEWSDKSFGRGAKIEIFT